MTSYVKNTDHLIDILRQQHVEGTGILVSFDPTSLFTQVPINERFGIITNKYQVEDHLINLMEHCLKTYFTYNGQRYRQTKGPPMGPPLSPVIANIFIESFETGVPGTDE
ncbi:hypothetical protein Trydic_g23402 [Trypoxylus dichotomus]